MCEILFIVKMMISLANLDLLMDCLQVTLTERENRKNDDDDEKFVCSIHFCNFVFFSHYTRRHSYTSYYIDVHRKYTHPLTADTKWVKYLVSIFGQWLKYHQSKRWSFFSTFSVVINQNDDDDDDDGGNSEDEFGGKKKLIATNTAPHACVRVSQFVTNY